MPKFKRCLTFISLFTLATSTVSASIFNRPNWSVEIAPFYAKATDSLLSNSLFAVKIPDPKILGDSKEEYHNIIDKDWGLEIAVKYNFPNCFPQSRGLKVDFNYFHPVNQTTVINNGRDTTGKPVLGSAEFIDITDESGAKFSHTSTRLDQQYDTLDLLGNQKFLFNPCFCFELFGGLRYFHLTEKLTNHYAFEGVISNTFVQNIYNINYKNESYNVGPRFGSCIYYRLANCVHLKGELGASFLYGEAESEFYNRYFLVPGTPFDIPTTVLNSSNHHRYNAHIFPALSGKVALTYEHRIVRCGLLVVEAGFRGDKYFNAVDDVAYQQLLAGDDINSKCNYQDFDVTGPYFSVSLHA